MPLPDGIVPISIYVPVEVRDFFKTLADEEKRTLSNMIGFVLETEYKRRKQMTISTEKQNIETCVA